MWQLRAMYAGMWEPVRTMDGEKTRMMRLVRLLLCFPFPGMNEQVFLFFAGMKEKGKMPSARRTRESSLLFATSLGKVRLPSAPETAGKVRLLSASESVGKARLLSASQTVGKVRLLSASGSEGKVRLLSASESVEKVRLLSASESVGKVRLLSD
jgi:hypothetical protein